MNRRVTPEKLVEEQMKRLRASRPPTPPPSQWQDLVDNVLAPALLLGLGLAYCLLLFFL